MGSSPHTRDKSSLALYPTAEARIIPAHAGQIMKFIDVYRCPRDHPRTRGTNRILPFCFLLLPGSSPHTRDKCKVIVAVLACFRIIPAHAGQISKCRICSSRFQDHPRTRGTNTAFDFFSLSNSGSSPHTRDKFPDGARHYGLQGIIPAHAGQINDKSHF